MVPSTIPVHNQYSDVDDGHSLSAMGRGFTTFIEDQDGGCKFFITSQLNCFLPKLESLDYIPAIVMSVNNWLCCPGGYYSSK